jgi:hypothetical protein
LLRGALGKFETESLFSLVYLLAEVFGFPFHFLMRLGVPLKKENHIFCLTYKKSYEEVNTYCIS